MAIRTGSQTGPRGKFGFRNIPKKAISMDMGSKNIKMSIDSKNIKMD